MPLYEYECQDCGREFEKMVRFSETSLLPECPQCHSRHTRKQIAVFAAALGASSGSPSTSSSGNCSPGGRFT
jgi:putative FmdB family regulatory protein